MIIGNNIIISYIAFTHVYLFTGNATTSFIRLVKGTSPKEGIVQAYANGVWRTLCSSDWNNNDAAVVCRSLGLPTYVLLHYFCLSWKRVATLLI